MMIHNMKKEKQNTMLFGIGLKKSNNYENII